MHSWGKLPLPHTSRNFWVNEINSLGGFLNAPSSPYMLIKFYVVSNTKEIVKKILWKMQVVQNTSRWKSVHQKPTNVSWSVAHNCSSRLVLFSKRNWSLFTKQLIACTTQFIIDNWPSTTHPARKSCLKYSRKCALHFQLCKASSPVNPKGSQPL